MLLIPTSGTVFTCALTAAALFRGQATAQEKIPLCAWANEPAATAF